MTASIRVFPFALAFMLGSALAACGGDDDDDDDSGAPEGAFVLASDFTSSTYGWGSAPDFDPFEELGPAEGDSVAVESGGRIVIIERTLGAVTVLANDLSIERNFSVADDGGVAPNPHDFAFVSDTKAYVTRFAQGTLAIVDPSNGTVTGTIDLASHDDDGVPDMDAVVVDGDRAFVSLERLDETFAPRADSELVVVDTGSDEVSDTLVLPLDNPTGRFRRDADGRLAIACVGAYGAADGGIVSLGSDGMTPQVLVTEETLGGDVGAFAILDDTHGYAIVAIDFVTHLVPFDPSTGTAGAAIVDSEGYDLSDLDVVGDMLVVADAAATAPGLRSFSLDGEEATTTPVSVGLPPRVVLAL